MQRGAPTQRGATNNTEDDDEDPNKDGDREPLFSREDPDDETGQDGGDGSDTNSDEPDAGDDEDKDVKVVIVKKS